MTHRFDTLKRLALMGGAFLFASPALAENGDFSKAPLELLDAGIFCPIDSTGQVEAPNTERGFIDLIEGDHAPDFATSIVPGELDIGFGIRYRTAPGAGEATVIVTTTHPPFGTPPITTEQWLNTVTEENASLSLFRFDDAYEIQYGEWSFEVSINDEVLLRQTFFVIPPEDSMLRLSDCQGPEVIS